MSKLISLSTMRPVVVPVCVIGQMVRYTGDMANHAGVGAIVAIRPAGRFGPQSYDVALDDGREICGTHLDESRWEVSSVIAPAEAVTVLRAGVTAKKALDAANKSAAEERHAQAVAKLRADYPWLEQGCGPVVAARNIRTELKRSFPSVKFNVRTEKYAGGNSVNISWTDGPNWQQVEEITNKYAGGHFNGMDDSYEYSRSPWIEVFGEARYVHCSRDYSDKALESVLRRVCDRLGGMEERPTVEDYRKGRLWNFKQSGGCDVGREVNVALSKHTYCLTR